MSQLLRDGPRMVLRRLLDWTDGLPVNAESKVYPSAEMRAIREHELFDEGIVPFGIEVVVGLVAARFGAVMVRAPNADYLTVITEIENGGAIPVTVRSNTAQTFDIEVFGGVAPRDLRLGVNEMFTAMLSSGTIAGVGGEIIGGAVPTATTKYYPRTGLVASFDPNGQGVLIAGGTAATAITVRIGGYLFPIE